jgi:hypothetical protein
MNACARAKQWNVLFISKKHGTVAVCIAHLCFKVSAENFERGVVYSVAKTVLK